MTGIHSTANVHSLIRRLFGLFAIVGLLTVANAARAGDSAEARRIVENSAQSVRAFRSGSNADTINALLERAQGVIVYPSIVKAAFLVGSEGGDGVLLGHKADGGWSDPAFFTFAGASYGLQIGVESSEVIIIIMNEETVTRAVQGGLELGSKATIAVGEEGLKAKLLSTDSLQDIYYFADTHGVFAGLNLKGSAAFPRDALSAVFYGTPANAEAVVLERSVRSEGAADLHAALGH
jgi:SH3 domain-containing YSC84-like protein 1